MRNPMVSMIFPGDHGKYPPETNFGVIFGVIFLKNDEKSYQEESKGKNIKIKYIRDTYGDSCDSPCLVS